MTFVVIYIISSLLVYLFFRTNLKKDELQAGIQLAELLMIFTPIFNSLAALSAIIVVIFVFVEKQDFKTTKARFYLVKKK